MQEIFLQDGTLITEDEWKRHITSLRPDKELVESEDVIARNVKRLVEDAIKERIEHGPVGIFFSGGLDSSYIASLCKRFNADFTCYTVGFQDGNFKEPEDIAYARKVAEFLKLKDDEFVSKIFNIKEIEQIIKRSAKIVSSIANGDDVHDVVNVSVGAVEVAAHSISSHEKIFFSGLGSEEIFAGYERHKKNPTNQECFDGLLAMRQRDLRRDSLISKSLGFSFSTPFLDEKLIRYALGIPIEHKVNGEGSKMILRKAAVHDLGEFSLRPKKAAQYGSSFDRAISKLAGMHGFKLKKDYLKSI